MDDVGLGEAGLDVADVAVQLGDDVALGVGDVQAGIVVQQRRAGLHRLLGVEHGGQQFVVDLDQRERRLGRRFAGRDDGGDALADVADDGVEHQTIGGIVAGGFVPPGRETPGRRVVVGQHRDDTRRRERGVDVDGDDARRRRAASAGSSSATGPEARHPSCSARSQ